MKTKRTVEFQRKEKHSFGYADKAGRALGCIVSYTLATFEQIPDSARLFYNVKPGRYFAWNGQVTRNGAEFGAIQPTHYCETEAERDAAVQKYIANAKKRARAHVTPEFRA